MKMRLAIRVIVALATVATVAQAAERIEVSKDGRQTVQLTAARDALAAARAPTVPFGAAPDWHNLLRLQVSSLAIGDVNRDGKNDLVVGCYSSSSFPPYTDWHNYIYANLGNQLESAPTWQSADQVHTAVVLIGDINNDGYQDIFSGNGGSGAAQSVIYFGTPTGPNPTPGWTSAVPGGMWATDALLADLDHDNDLDVILAGQGVSPNPFRLMRVFYNNNGTLESSPSWQSATANIQSSLALGDLDNDGWEDLAVALWTNGFQSGVHRNVNGVLTTSMVWTTGVSDTDKGVSWADIDHDGWQDLAIGRSPTVIYHNNNGVLAPIWSSTITSQPEQLGFFDVNSDGWADLVEVYFSDGRTRIYMNQQGTFNTTPDWTYDSTAVGTAFALGDINGDGRPDLAIGYSGDPSVVLFYGQAPPLHFGDMNCDGAVDFADINPFVLALTDPQVYQQQFPDCDYMNADINQDLLIDFGDINPFVALLTGGGS